MIPISNDARTILMGKSVDDWVEIFLTPTFDGAATITFTDRDIVEDSLSVVRRCSDKSAIKFGTSSYSELNVHMYYQLGENDYRGSKVVIKHYLRINDTTSECIMQYTFYVDKIEQVSPDVISIRAYDIAQKLEMALGSSVMSGTPISILAQVNRKAGVRIFDIDSGATTPEEYADLPNIESTIQLSEAENGCKTLRDVVNAVGQMIGIFYQTVPGEEHIGIYRYHTDVDLVIGLQNRSAFSHVKHTIHYDSLQVTSTKGTFVSPTGHAITDNTFIIDDGPAWDYGTNAGLQARTDELSDWVKQYEYTPGSLTLFTDPTIECGDRLKVVAADEDYELLVTEVEWNYRGNTVITSAGEDNVSSTVSGTTNRKSGITEASNKLVMYSVTNANAISLDSASDPNRLCRITFSTMGATEVTWLGEVLVNAIISTNPYVEVKVTYVLDGEELTYSPKADYVTPKNVLSMFRTAGVDEQSAHIWEVYLSVTQGEITVSQFEFSGTLMGQNLVINGNDWGGILTLFDDVAKFVASAVMRGVQEGDVTVSFYTPITRILSDNVEGFVAEAELKSLGESVTITLTYEDVIFCHDNGYCGGGMLL